MTQLFLSLWLGEFLRVIPDSDEGAQSGISVVMFKARFRMARSGSSGMTSELVL
ncbi:hypothetical protein THOG11_60116 [Vibrio harveyi]|nr:hypothetical protein TH15OA1_430174 [Vibrio harveyi]CAH1574086.1 hypothetical protein THOD03_50118 [Vibrio harveyi]CAH1583325.1 hypothetical protein THOG11_60116 [Vibrio harveyi]